MQRIKKKELGSSFRKKEKLQKQKSTKMMYLQNKTEQQ